MKWPDFGLHARIGKRLTRFGLESFYQSNLKDVKGTILNIGSGNQDLSYGNCSTIVRVDIRKTEQVDVVADTHNLPLPDSSFDAIICKEVLEHLYHPHKAIEEMLRVLKPGGKFVGSTCFYWPIHGAPIDYFRYTRFGLEKLFEQWSDVKIVAKNGFWGALGIHLVRLAGGRHLLTKLLYPLIIAVAFGLIYSDRLFKSSSRLKCITSGYYITAVKPGEAI